MDNFETELNRIATIVSCQVRFSSYLKSLLDASVEISNQNPIFVANDRDALKVAELETLHEELGER
jgi:hypothetical protein